MDTDKHGGQGCRVVGVGSGIGGRIRLIGVSGNGIRFVWKIRVAGVAEALGGRQRAVEGAFEVGLIAMDEGEAVARDGAGGLVDEGFPEAPATAPAPDGGDEVLDEGELDGVDGLEAVGEGFEHVFEGVGVLVGEDEGLGEEAVGGRVRGGALFAFGGDGAVGAGAVGARGLDASDRGHRNLRTHIRTATEGCGTGGLETIEGKG
jgi:hypothetical protein